MAQVVFVGSKIPAPKDIKLQFALHVRREKVKAALLWLIEHNVLYKRKYDAKELRISQENLDRYPEDDVPEPVLMDMIVHDIDAKMAARDTSGYTRADDDLDDDEDDEDMD